MYNVLIIKPTYFRIHKYCLNDFYIKIGNNSSTRKIIHFILLEASKCRKRSKHTDHYTKIMLKIVDN